MNPRHAFGMLFTGIGAALIANGVTATSAPSAAFGAVALLLGMCFHAIEAP